jgi:dipeptidyl aminopeptidase/acylaminoacyl peptidase
VAVRPYGTWPSDLGSELVARGAGRYFGAVWLEPGRLRWLEYRADEGGRGVVVEQLNGAESRDVSPAGFNVRTRVHEYGGGAAWTHGEAAFCSSFDDSRLYRIDGAGEEPRALTPEPKLSHGLRFADGCVTPDSATVICVRERHGDGEPINELVAFPANAPSEPTVIFSGSDFVSTPRLDPTGERLAWLAWNHPCMPWDGTELWVGELDDPDGARRVAGGPGEAIFQPEWDSRGALHFSSDRSGWWNLYRFEPDGSVTPLTDLEGAEIGAPAWLFGMRRYAFLDEGRIACVVTREAADSLQLLELASGRLEPVELEWTEFTASCFASGDGQLAFAAASPRTPRSLVVLDPDTGQETRVRRSFEDELEPASISVPRAIEFPTGDGGTAHAFFYPPTNADSGGPEDERPPLRVVCHGGPTAHSPPSLAVGYQFFTQRGIGVVDVNHRGSTGFGREYRRLLEGRWGEIDWRDCVAAARHLADAGETDLERTWISGGSAGGYVVLCTLVFDPTALAAGASYYGVADAEALARDTHKFESRYLDSLIGPYPERADLYRARSPIHFMDRLERPLLILQGLDDEVVPPSQSEAMVEVLERKGIPYAYLPFAGEGHGFRKLENIQRALEAELGFAGRIFGFGPADELEPVEIANLTAS